MNALQLWWENILFQFRYWADSLWIRFNSNKAFRQVDKALLHAYRWDNPYTISKRFLEEKGESEIYAYGETPLRTMDQIVRTCGITAQDTIYELGCGRGRTCFWLALVLQAKCVGIDYIPAFIVKAQTVQEKFALTSPQFVCEDFLNSDLTPATVLYLHGTCMSDGDILRLSEKLLQLPIGTKVITVSFSLTDYPLGDRWELIKKFPATFSWGTTEVYWQTISRPRHG